MEGGENSFEWQKDADEIKSKDIHYSGQAGDDVWLRVLGIKEERWKKVKYNRDENAKNDVGCDLKGQVKKWGSQKKDNCNN